MTDPVIELNEEPEAAGAGARRDAHRMDRCQRRRAGGDDGVETETTARTIATFDRDTFIDYRARRPIMELRDGVNTG